MHRRMAITLLFACACLPILLAVSTGSRLFAASAGANDDAPTTQITIDYPAEGSIFPPDMVAPTFIWHDPNDTNSEWQIELAFTDGSSPLREKSLGEKIVIGEIDPRCIAKTNEVPTLSPEQAAAHTWVPSPKTWAYIKKHSIEHPVKITITGFPSHQQKDPVSQGQVTIKTSKDPVGAPIFYRDVPLMPSEGRKGLISPIDPSKIGLITWRLKDVSEPGNRQLISGFHTCANCHSFSTDGKTMGADLDGPSNEKGLYSIFPVKPQTVIAKENVIAWSTFRGKLGGKMRVAFMPQISPDGKYVIASINDPGAEDPKHMGDVEGKYYVQNFKDYRFSQVFFPTRGILAWYSRDAGKLQPLPGADDYDYVQTDAFWSPDGKYIVFARALSRDPFPLMQKKAVYANDPNETQIQYDLYRIPFNDGKGGKAEPIVGASQNAMSNSFPKVSPDGRWIVYVQARNAMLMRPDSQLYIVPAQGGVARRMHCNLSLMNSWHSFSPNGHWLVFSSKGRSPYTQMFLTHIDENGDDSPAILIENTTAANRAVNIPEFVNVPKDGLMSITSPATEFYELFDRAKDLTEQKQNDAALALWKQVLQIEPDNASALVQFGITFDNLNRPTDALAQYQKALQVNPLDPNIHNLIGVDLVKLGQPDDAIAHFQKAEQLDPKSVDAHWDLGTALVSKGQLNDAIVEFQKASDLLPQDPSVRLTLGKTLLDAGRFEEAIPQFERLLAANPNSAPANFYLARALADSGKVDAALPYVEKALAISPDNAEYNFTYGRFLIQKEKFAEAIPPLQKALAANPNSAPAHDYLGVALLSTNKPSEAFAEFQKAVNANPNLPSAQSDLGDAYFYVLGKPAEALQHWRKSLELDPNQPAVLNQVAWLLATSPDDSLRNGPEALADAIRAVQQTQGNEPETLDVLGAALAEVQRFPEAVQAATRAQALATQANNPQLAQALNARIALYQSGKPFREPIQPHSSPSSPSTSQH